MSVQTEIARIAQAKTDIKNVVNSKVANTITNQTIDAFPPLIDSSIAAYKNLIPWIEGSGSSFTIDNAEAGKLDKFEMYGNTHQDSYTGKNLLEPYNSAATRNGITCTYDSTNQTYTFNGTCTADNTFFNIANNEILFTSGATTSSTHWVSGSVSNYCSMRHFDSNYNKGIIYSLITLSSSNPVVYKTATDNFNAPQNKQSIRFNNGSVANNFKIKIMIANSTDTTYEPFVGGSPSPSPDYPQDVRVVTGNNSVKVVGKNLAHNVSYTSQTTQYSTLLTSSYSVTKDKYYAISVDTPNTGIECYINYEPGTYLEKVGSYPSFVCDGNRKTFIAKGTNNITENSYNLVKRMTATSSIETGLLSNFMIEEIPSSSSTSTDYEPYQNQTYPINLGTIELCKIGSYQDYIYKENNKWYKHSEIGKVVYDGSETWGSATESGKVRCYNTSIASLIKKDVVPFINYFIGTLDTNKFFSDGYAIIPSSGNISFYATNITTSTTNFKTWLSTHNTAVYYVLATPTYEIITNETLVNQLEAIETHTGTNIFEVFNENNVLPDLYVLTEKQNSYKNWKIREGIN